MNPLPNYRYAQHLWTYTHYYPISNCWSKYSQFSYVDGKHLSKVLYKVYSITYNNSNKEMVSVSEMKKDREKMIEDILE